MDLSLEEIIAADRKHNPRFGHGNRRPGSGHNGRQLSGSEDRGHKGHRYTQGWGGRQLGATEPRNNMAGRSEAGRLLVTNLHPGVTQRDMEDLFSEFDGFRGAVLHYNLNGMSRGSATVEFSCKSDALSALQKYNGVPLDNIEMRIELAQGEQDLAQGEEDLAQGDPPAGGPHRRHSIGGVVGQNRGGTERWGGTGCGAKRRSETGGRNAFASAGPPDEETLDREMEEYMSNWR